MAKLKHTKGYRRGRTRRKWRRTSEVEINIIDTEAKGKAIELSHSMGNPGGQTIATIDISPRDYETILKYMVEASPAAAHAAMASRLAIQLRRLAKARP